MIAMKSKPDVDWHIRLIETRGRRVGLAGADLDDAVQEITPKLLAFCYDRERSNGASLRTALTGVIDKCLLTIHRRNVRYANCLDRARGAKRAAFNNETPSYEDSTPLRLDVREALSQFSDNERRICESLSHGYSIREVAKQLGCDWHTVKRNVDRIRIRFTEIGLDGWLKTA